MVYIKLPDKIHNNYGLEFWDHGNALDAMKFQEWMMINVFNTIYPKNTLRPFFQGGFNDINGDWRYVEFWCKQEGEDVHELILEIAEEVSLKLKCDFDIK